MLCASPSYLAARGCPTDPDDLGSHDCITVDSVAAPRSWKFIKAAREIAAPIRSRLTVSDSEAAISGAGITRVMLRAFLNWVIPRLKGRLA
ncbi:MAG TPA: LysR substrate-binding domain-containing protein [Bradyrhizobium sp.]